MSTALASASAPARSYPPFPALASEDFAPRAVAASRYHLTDLGVHLDGSPLLPVALSDTGDICVSVTSSQPAGIVRGFRVSGSARIPCGVAFGHAPALALSRNGHIAGVSGTAPKALRAWASHAGIFGDQLWPGSVSVARGINSSGQVIGNVLFDTGDVALSRAFVFNFPGYARLLTPPQGGTTFATGINDAGDIVFNAAPLGADPGETRAWCLHEQHYIAIASLGGGRAWATAITPGGRVVGHSLTETNETHAFLWEDGVTHDLGTLGGAMSQALAANDQRSVVGRIVDAHAGTRAFRWSPDAGLVPLDELVGNLDGWSLHEANGINRDGMIVGLGTYHGQRRGFLLRPELVGSD
jgi:probable HAF family extracellular repeat protein